MKVERDDDVLCTSCGQLIITHREYWKNGGRDWAQGEAVIAAHRARCLRGVTAHRSVYLQNRGC